MTAPRRLQLRRGNTAAISAYVGAAGELVVNTTTNTLHLHDGSTVGGYVVTANTISLNANITQANVGMQGYVNLANTIQSSQIANANVGMRGYVDATIAANIANIAVGTAYSNANVKSYLTSGFDGNILPSANVTYSLGSITQQWRDLFVSNNTIYIGGVPLSINASGSLTVAGNIIAGTNLVTYGSNVSASAVTLSGPTGAVGNVHVLDPGNGFTMFGFFAGSGGSGTGFSIVAQNSTIFNPVQFNIRGTGYRVGDVITIVNTNTGPGYSDATVVVTELLSIVSPGIYVGNTAYKFGADGNIRLPAGGGILDSTGVSVLGTGGTSYSNVNVAAYTTTQGFTNFSNVNVAAYVTTANSAVIGYVDNKVSTANVGVIGYVDLANTIQSNQISAANLGMRGYVDNQITTITGGAPAILDTLGELANALGADANLSVTITSQIANVNANITTANLGMRGYVDSQNFYSNAKVATYLPTYSGNIAADIVSGKLRTTKSAPTVAQGVVGDNDGDIAIENNFIYICTTTFSNVSSYTANIDSNESGGSVTNIDIAVPFGTLPYYITPGWTISWERFGTQTRTIETISAGTWGGTRVSWATQGTASILPTTTIFTLTSPGLPDIWKTVPLTSFETPVYGNVQVGVYTNLNTYAYSANVTSANVGLKGYVDSQSFYSNVKVATYLPTYDGNIAANISKAGYTWTFGTGGTTQFPNSLILAPVSQSITMQSDQYSQLMWENANLTVAPNMAINSNFYVAQNSATLDIGYRDGSSTQLIKSWYWSVDGNLKLPSGGYILNSDDSIYGAGSSYSNVEVATYLPTYSGNIANVRLGTSGVLTFADGTTQITAGGAGGTNYSNVNVAAYVTTNGLTNYSNVNVKAYTETMGFKNYSNVNVAAYLATATITTTGNITAQNLIGNISITGNVTGTSANVTLQAGAYTSVFDNQGNVTVPRLFTAGNIQTAGYLFGNGTLLTGVAIKTTGSWTVPTGNSTQSFTVPTSGTYQLWVDCNIPNGILAWNATATVTNSNVPVVGVQYAWVYNGGGTPIDFTSIPNQFVGTGNTIVRSSVSPSATTNRFDFGINNTSGGNVTVSYGYVKIS